MVRQSALLLVAAALLLPAQDAPARKNTYRPPAAGAPAAPRLISPEIHPGGTVTFRIRAPKATEVSLSLQSAKR